jgi:hypothetical protein
MNPSAALPPESEFIFLENLSTGVSFLPEWGQYNICRNIEYILTPADAKHG